MSDLDDILAALNGRCRIEIDTTIILPRDGKPSSSVHYLQVYKTDLTKGGNEKWTKVGPLILPPEHEDGSRGTRVDLLEWVADLVRVAAIPTPSLPCRTCGETAETVSSNTCQGGLAHDFSYEEDS